MVDVKIDWYIVERMPMLIEILATERLRRRLTFYRMHITGRNINYYVFCSLSFKWVYTRYPYGEYKLSRILYIIYEPTTRRILTKQEAMELLNKPCSIHVYCHYYATRERTGTNNVHLEAEFNYPFNKFIDFLLAFTECAFDVFEYETRRIRGWWFRIPRTNRRIVEIVMEMGENLEMELETRNLLEIIKEEIIPEFLDWIESQERMEYLAMFCRELADEVDDSFWEHLSEAKQMGETFTEVYGVSEKPVSGEPSRGNTLEGFAVGVSKLNLERIDPEYSPVFDRIYEIIDRESWFEAPL